MGAANKMASFPFTDRADDAWAERLTAYPGGGIERGNDAHDQELLAAGWRYRPSDGAWDPPPAKRQRRSVEQVGETVRRFVQRIDVRRPPASVLGCAIAVMVGSIEALGDLLFHATTDEACAAGADALLAMGEPGRAVLRALGVAGVQRDDPLAPLFHSALEVLGRAMQQPSSRALGAGAQSYAIAESRGRTRAGWDEMACSPTHSSSGSVKGLREVEMAIDAQRSVMGADLAPIDLAGLTDWLRDKVGPEERVRRYRQRLAIERGTGVLGVVSDAAANEATAELTDKSILHRLTKARERLDRSLGRLPAHAERLAIATGDMSFLAPRAAPRRKKAPPPRPGRRSVDPICSPAPRCM